MIPKYFRCKAPKCKLATTREIAKEGDGWECPLKSPNCTNFREDVSIVEGITGGRSGLFYSAVAAIVALVIVSLIAGAGNEIQDSLTEMRERLSKLEQSVGELEKQKGIPQGDDLNLSTSIDSFLNESKLLQSQVDSAFAKKDQNKIAEVRRSLESLVASGNKLKQSIDRPNSGSGVGVAEAKRLLTEIQGLQVEGETVLEEARNDSPEDAVSLEDFVSDTEVMMSRARKLAAPSRGGVKSTLVALSKKIDEAMGGLSSAQSKLELFVPAPVMPFDPSEAVVTIGAAQSLTRSLAAPLVAGWSSGKSVDGPNDMSFIEGGTKGKILIQSMSLNEGFKRLAAGELSLFITDRSPTALELESFGAGFRASRSVAEVIALDAMTLLAHPDSSLETLELGRPLPMPLAVGGSESLVRRKAVLFGLKGAADIEEEGESAVMVRRDVIAAGLYHREKENLRAKRLAVKASSESLALKPSPFTIATEDYPFSFRIVAWTNKTPKEDALALVKYITSNAGQEVVSQSGYVDLRLRPMQSKVEPEILAALGAALGVDRVNSAIRLSTNLRFETGESELDLKALGDLERLPRYVAKNYSDHKVVILGFTDTDGTSEFNRKLSIDRAETVAARLRASQVDTRATGLGMAFPVDSNSTDAGKAKNRRAEVWVAKP